MLEGSHTSEMARAPQGGGETWVDLAFPARGAELLLEDHGYALYGALSRHIQALHGAPWLAVQGICRANRRLSSARAEAALRLRVPQDRIRDVLPLAGASLRVANTSITLGVPTVAALRPAAQLDARLVVIKLTNGAKFQNEQFSPSEFADRFQKEAARQLRALGIDSTPEIRGRASLQVGGRRIIGCALRVEGLSAEQSVALQSFGIGGKRSMGCGVFRPMRGSQQ